MTFVCPTKSEAEDKIKTANQIREMLKDIEKDLKPEIHPVCVPFCVPLCNASLLNRQESKRKIANDTQDSNYCFPCCVPCGPYGERVPELKKEKETNKKKRKLEKDKKDDDDHNLPFCIPIYPPCQPRKEKEHAHKFDPPKVMVCYREKVKECKKSNKRTEDVEEEVHRLHQSQSRELRASILYTGCYCERRNGLQDDCPRTGCHGSPECLTKPPSCGPSEFCDGKHLGKKLKIRKVNGKQNGADGHNGETTSRVASQGSVKAKYMCFPATVKNPVICFSPCVDEV